MKKYRIVMSGSYEYHVQERFLWFFWSRWVCDSDFGCSDTPCIYASAEEARKAIDKQRVTEIVEYV